MNVNKNNRHMILRGFGDLIRKSVRRGSSILPWRGWSVRIFYGIIIIPLILLTTSMVMQDERNGYLDPQSELESFRLADGFEVTLFAAEPMVINPIQMNWDTEGRLWVVSSTAYPHLNTGEEANDKIYVLEDTDADGKADKSTVFAEGLITPTGILPGDGGVYVANSTEILHFVDTDGDGKADKKRRILSGFGTADTHHLIHTFRWGPEGLLYFNQSIYIYSHVETPSGIRRLEGGGVWQLRRETLDLEIYARGLINPWGLTFDRWGQSFLTDGAGREGINYAFPGATFVTAPGAERIVRGLNPGQPKHCGLEVVSGRHLPESWQGSLITNDFRANRINRFELEEQGAGYASRQVDDLLWTDHVAFRPVDISIGPDGAIYVADWYNQIIQHGEVDFHDPRRDHQHGRIWRIVAKDRPLVKIPRLEKATIEDLLQALKLPEDWTRSQTKQVLKARGANEVIPKLQRWISELDKKDPGYEHHLLEALWVHQSFNAVNEQLLLRLLNAESHNARAAALRTLQFWHDRIANAPVLLSKAVLDKHPQVRLEAVIALRKIQTAESARTALSVLENQMDEFIDYALWQTIRELEPFVMSRIKTEPGFFGNSRKMAFALKSVSDPDAISYLVQLYQKNQIPEEYRMDVLNSIAKRGKTADLNILFDMAVEDYSGDRKSVAAQLGVLLQASRERDINPDKNLNRIARFIESNDEAIAVAAIDLIGYWSMDEMKAPLINLTQTKGTNIKKAALSALATVDKDEAEKLLIGIATGRNAVALQLLATSQLVSLNLSEAARLAAELLSLPLQEDASQLFHAFLSHKDGARVLAEALMRKKIPENIAKVVRKSFERQVPWRRNTDEDVKLLRQALEASGGFLPPERMRQQLSDREISSLAIQIKETADPELGEMVFRKSNCAPCHGIGGAGGLMGPDLSSLGTSSHVETIIESILFPSRSIKEGYELQRAIKKDGDEMTGYLVSNGSSEVVLRDMTGKRISIAKSQLDRLERIPGSLMPPGLTAGLEKEEFNNLVGFLSKLGTSGKYRVPNSRFIRRWQVVSADKELAKKISEEGLGHIISKNAKIFFRPVYSKVSGRLPVEELPAIEVNPNQSYSLVRFGIEVLSRGNVKLLMNSTAGITAWVGQEPLTLADDGAVANLPEGIHQITLAINRKLHQNGPLAIQLEDAWNSPAQTRLVMGE
jgi:putative heme-binding domain-containing protein